MASVLNEEIQGVKQLIELNKILIDQLRLVATESKKLTKSMKFETSSDFKNLDKELKEITAATKQLISLEREQARLGKDLANTEKAQAQALKAKNSALIQARKEEERQIKIAKKLENDRKKLTSIYAKESARLNNLRKKYKDLALSENGATTATRKLKKEIQELDSRLKKVDADVGQFQRSVGNYKSALAGSLGTVGQFATGAGAIGASVLLAGRAISSAIDIVKGFEQANANLQAVLGTTREEMQPLIDQAKSLGASTSFSASEVTGLQTELAKLGFPISDIQQMASSTLDAANAMGSDLGAQAALTGATLRSFNLDASETQRVNDVLSKATSASALDFNKLQTAMSTIAPVANSFGFSLEGTTALLGELSNAGFDASSAATSTRNILLNLADANGTLAKKLGEPVKDLPSLVAGLKKLEKQGVDLGEALELTDKRSVAAFSTFLKGTDSVLALNDTLLQASGTAEEMANIQLATLEGSLKILNSSFEGLVLSIEGSLGSSKLLTVAVKTLSNILSTLSGETGKLKKSQSELNDENIETIKNARENSKENENLADRYEELTSKVELNAEEREELNKITTDLIAKFGESVSVINQETGALEINIAAVRKKILADKILESETAKTLLVEKARLETQIELAEKADDTLNALSATFKGSLNIADNTILKLIESAKKGNLEYSKTLQEIRFGFIQTGEDTTEFDNKLSAIEGTLLKTSKAVTLLNGNQIELNKINEQFLDLGIDIDEVLSSETKSIQGNSKARQKLIGLIQKQQKVLSDLQKQQKEASSEKQIASLTNEIKLAQEELKRLQDLGKEPVFEDQFKGETELLIFRQKQAETLAEEITEERLKDLNESKKFNQEKLHDAIRAIQNEEEVRIQSVALRTASLLENDKLTSFERQKIKEEEAEAIRLIQKQSLDDQIKLQEEANKKIANLDKERIEALKKLLNDRLDLLDKAIDKGIEAQREAHQERLKQIDEEIAANRKLQKDLVDQAKKSTADLDQNLVFARQKERDAQLKRIQEVERQKRVEEGFAFLKLLTANASNPNEKTPVLKTIAQFTAAKLAIDALSGFFHGTDNTGNDGKLSDNHGPITGYTHKNEMVMNSDEVDKMSSMGVNTRKDAFKLMELGEQHLKGKLIDVNNKSQALHVTNLYQSNEQSVLQMNELIHAVEKMPSKIMIPETTWDDKEQAWIRTRKKAGRIERIHESKKGGLWGS